MLRCSSKSRLSHCKVGANNLWQTLDKSSYFSDELEVIIDLLLQRIGFLSYMKTTLLGLVTDNRKHIRRIVKAKFKKTKAFRKFTVPVLNVYARNYTDLFSWKDSKVSVSSGQGYIWSRADWLIKGEAASVRCPRLLCHKRAVGRCTDTVTEACMLFVERTSETVLFMHVYCRVPQNHVKI